MGLTLPEILLSSLIKRPRLFVQVREHLQPEPFGSNGIGNELVAQAVSIAIDHYDRYGTVPAPGVVGAKAQKLPNAMRKMMRRIDKYEPNPSDDNWVVDEVESAIKQYRVRELAFHVVDEARKGADSIDLASFAKALNITCREDKNVMRLKHDLHKRVAGYLSPEIIGNVVPTGMRHVDEVLGGGLEAGELGVILAATKKGKTHILINIGAAAASVLEGLKVVHWSCEMRYNKVLARYDRRISGGAHVFFKDQPAKFVTKLRRRMGSMVSGDVCVISYPTKTMTLSMMRRDAERLRASGFDFDLAIVDYGDIMKPERNHEHHRHAVASCFEDLRTFAGEYEVPVWTATQANREGSRKDRPMVEDVGEAFEKIQILDALLVYGESEEQRANKQGTFYVFQRDESSGAVIDLHVDKRNSFVKTLGIQSEAVKVDKRSKEDKETVVASAIESKLQARAAGLRLK